MIFRPTLSKEKPVRLSNETCEKRWVKTKAKEFFLGIFDKFTPALEIRYQKQTWMSVRPIAKILAYLIIAHVIYSIVIILSSVPTSRISVFAWSALFGIIFPLHLCLLLLTYYNGPLRFGWFWHICAGLNGTIWAFLIVIQSLVCIGKKAKICTGTNAISVSAVFYMTLGKEFFSLLCGRSHSIVNLLINYLFLPL